MFRISRLQELMKGVSRDNFDRLVQTHAADKHSKGFGSWDQLVAMVYGHLNGAESLRAVETGFNSQDRHHYHLGTRTVRRSTLAEANGKRTPELFAEVARDLMAQASRTLRRKGEECLYLLDSTSITLKGRGFDEWTLANRTRHTQGMKLHVLYAANGHVPMHQSMTAANVNDLDEGVKLPIERGATYVFDKGYCDYNWWARMTDQGALFVTRFKRNAALRVERALPIADELKNMILADEVVRFSNPYPGAKRRNLYINELRRVVVARPDHPQQLPLVLATNDLESPAQQIAQRYKDRWQIELFFKWIKQHLKIRRFLGRSENAVRIQILCALITFLLLAQYRKASGSSLSLWHFLNEVRATLFQRPEAEAERYPRRRERLAEIAKRQATLFA